MKKLLLTSTLIACTIVGFAQNLTLYNKDSKWGWKDERGKKVVIEAKYEAERGFNQQTELATVKLNGKWGMINKAGETVIPFEYDDFGSIDNGKIAAKKDGKMGFINKEGAVVLPFKYDLIRSSSYGELYLIKLNGKWGMMDLNMNELCTPQYDNITLFGVKPFVYKASRDGQNVRLDAQGKEEAEIGSTSDETTAKKDNQKGQKVTNYHCPRCGKTGVSYDAFVPEKGGACREPNGRGGYKTSTSHQWKKTK